MRYYEKDNCMLFENPQKTAALMKYRMRILECISEDGDIPEAWSGCYADLCLKTAGSMIGAGEVNEGFVYLEKAFTLYDAWLKIPEGKKMDAGAPVLFENAKISKADKNCVVSIFFEDGTTVWTPYLWLFWQIPDDIFNAMTKWPWFDNVREDERYAKFLAKAKEMAEAK